jgi:hypothetical protein
MHPGDETAKFPGAPNRPQNQLGASSVENRWAENSSFIKLENIRLSYSLPAPIANNLHLSKTTIFANVHKALVFTQYDGYDPESTTTGSALTPGIDNALYPVPRVISFGINIKF